MSRAMLKHMLKHPGQALLGGIGTYVTNAQTDLRRAWLSRGDHLTSRNARAHIRRFSPADFGDKR